MKGHVQNNQLQCLIDPDTNVEEPRTHYLRNQGHVIPGRLSLITMDMSSPSSHHVTAMSFPSCVNNAVIDP